MAQLVEHDLAKVGAAGSSPVSCSIETQKDIRKDVFFVFTSPAGARGFEVSAPLRSAQSGRPPDVLRRLELLKSLVFTRLFIFVLEKIIISS